MDERGPKFAIGQCFKTQGKHPKVCKIIDIHKTYDSQGKLVKFRYVATHEFVGQILTDYEVVEATVARGLIH